MISKLRFLLLPLAVVLAIALGGGIYWFLESQGIVKYPEFISKLLPWEEPDPTKDWKTYTNEDYGFSLKYPKGWEVIVQDLSEGKKGFHFVSGIEELPIGTDRFSNEIRSKGDVGIAYPNLALFPIFSVYPEGIATGITPSELENLERKYTVSLGGVDGYVVYRWKDGSVSVWPPEGTPLGGKFFMVRFYPNPKDLSTLNIFDAVFETLEIL